MKKLALMSLSAALAFSGDGFRVRKPQQPKLFTRFDQERLDAAEEKRQRKAEKRLRDSRNHSGGGIYEKVTAT